MSRIDVPQNSYADEVAQLLPQGSEAVVAYIFSLPFEERVEASRSAQKTLFAAVKDVAGLDTYADAMRKIIDRSVSGLRTVGSSEEDDKTLDAYNAMSYNLSADLADCWPDDPVAREQRHFELGLRAAEDCVRWRNELNKPPRSFSIAYWAKGMHLLSLGHYSGAVKSFNLGLGFALRAAQDAGKLAPLGPESTFDVLLSTGYLGLAELLDGQTAGQVRYDGAVHAFEQQVERGTRDGDAELKEDAEFGIAQLETVRRKYVA
jgi:hypothetical protein